MKITREELIDKLIDDDIDTFLSRQAPEYAEAILREGFCGYNNQSNRQLMEEYQERFTEKIELEEREKIEYIEYDCSCIARYNEKLEEWVVTYLCDEHSGK